MAKSKKKQTKGLASAFLTQKQAMRRLQLSLPNFRRLCILKGVYPVEPSNRKKVGKGNSQPRIFYNAKDISFLAHEPLIQKFRRLRIYQLKLKKARERNDKDKESCIRANKPRYTLHHLVKERYPSRRDALNDISDSLNLIFLFARLPRLTQFSPVLIGLSRRLSVEFLNLVIATQAVRKAFISIKGFYVEAHLDGTPVIWVIPHSSVTHSPTDVDYRILATCLEFDITLVGSILCHLYRLHGLQYPPKLSVPVHPDPTNYYCGQTESHFEMLAGLSYPLKRIDEAKTDDLGGEELQRLQEIDDQITQAIDKQMEDQQIKNLFKGKRFFLSREVPREILCLIVRSCGGDCSWDKTVGLGSTFSEDDPSIDFQIVDRPSLDMKVTRYYVQPQWVFDCLNARRLLPTQDYLPGVTLPAHLSPFTVGSGFSDLTALGGETSVSQRGGLTGVAPGFGEGAAIYRPPEADYFAGLVSLAELRGKSVQAQAVRGQLQCDMDQNKAARSPSKQLTTESPNVERSTATKTHKKSSKMKKPAKGENPVITPGRLDSATSQAMREKAEANAERKLKEMLLPKKQRNAYKKMVYSIERKQKEVRQLKNKRSVINSSRST